MVVDGDPKVLPTEKSVGTKSEKTSEHSSHNRDEKHIELILKKGKEASPTKLKIHGQKCALIVGRKILSFAFSYYGRGHCFFF